MSSSTNGSLSPVKSPPPVTVRTSLSRVMSPVKSPSCSSPTSSSSSVSHLTLEERFNQLVMLLGSGPTLIQGKSINSELLFDVLIAVYFECQRSDSDCFHYFPLTNVLFVIDRVIATTRNKQQQRFCEFIKPFLDLIFDLHLKVVDFEQLKIIGRYV